MACSRKTIVAAASGLALCALHAFAPAESRAGNGVDGTSVRTAELVRTLDEGAAVEAGVQEVSHRRDFRRAQRADRRDFRYHDRALRRGYYGHPGYHYGNRPGFRFQFGYGRGYGWGGDPYYGRGYRGYYW